MNYVSISDLLILAVHCGTRSWRLAGQRTHHARPYLENGIFLFLPSSSVASATWRRLLFYHAATCFSDCIVKTGLLQCGAVWISVYDTRSVAASFQCCNASLAGLGPRDYVTEQMKKLNWLPIKYRINFKLCLMMNAAVTGQCPQYIRDI